MGANAHTTVYMAPQTITNEFTEDVYVVPGRIADYDAVAAKLAQVPGVTRTAPVIRGQVMASANDSSNVAEVFGVSLENLRAMPRIVDPATSVGSLADFDRGIAIGSGIARELAVGLGDRIRLIAPEGARTAIGTTPRVKAYEVTYIFSAGRYDIDRTRIYMPMAEAQSYFNREGVADEIEVFVTDPEQVDDWTLPLLQAAGDGVVGADMQERRLRGFSRPVRTVSMSVLVLIASMNITSGLIMLVKNKGRDIGILRTMGLTEGAVLRVFFLCGAFTGVIGTIAGVVLGVLLALNVDNIMAALNALTGGGAWQPEVRGIYRLPAELRAWDIFRAVALSLALSFVVTIFPARRAARMNPVEALRYE